MDSPSRAGLPRVQMNLDVAGRNVAPHMAQRGLSRAKEKPAGEDESAGLSSARGASLGRPRSGKALSAPGGFGQPQARLNLSLAATQSPLLIIAKPMPLQAFAPGPGDLPPLQALWPLQAFAPMPALSPIRRLRHPVYDRRASASCERSTETTCASSPTAKKRVGESRS
jgi:hypothetical protein